MDLCILIEPTHNGVVCNRLILPNSEISLSSRPSEASGTPKRRISSSKPRPISCIHNTRIEITKTSRIRMVRIP